MNGQPVASYPIVATIRVGRADVSGVLPSLDEVDRKAKDVQRSALGIGSALTAAATAAVVGLGMGVTKAIQLGTEMETATGNIVSLYMSMEGLSAAAASRTGKSVVQQLSEDAAKGVGELSNYIDTYQQIFAPARGAGASLDEIRRLTRLTVSAGFGLQGNRGLINAPLDIQQSLTAGAGDRTTPIVMAALRSIGVGGAEFNKLTTDKRIDTLMEAFGSFEGAADMMGQTVEAQTATMSDAVKRFARQATEPIFEGFKAGLIGANATLAENDAALAQLASRAADAAEGLGALVERTVSGAADLAAGVASADPFLDAEQRARDALNKSLGRNSMSMEKFGNDLTTGSAALVYFAEAGYAGIRYMFENMASPFEAARQVAQSQEDPNSLYTFYPGAGYQRNTRDYLVDGTPQYMLTQPDMLTQDPYGTGEMLAPVRELVAQGKKEKKIKVELKLARVEWGNDRSLVRALEPVLAEVADRASRLGRESSLSSPMGE